MIGSIKIEDLIARVVVISSSLPVLLLPATPTTLKSDTIFHMRGRSRTLHQYSRLRRALKTERPRFNDQPIVEVHAHAVIQNLVDQICDDSDAKAHEQQIFRLAHGFPLVRPALEAERARRVDPHLVAGKLRP